MTVWFALKAILIGLCVFLLLDYLRLSVISYKWYQERLKAVPGRDQNHQLRVHWYGALPIWILVILGLVFFISLGGGAAMPLGQVAIAGATFGAIIYGVYNLTNYSLFRQWPMQLVAVDTLRGAFVCMCVAISMVTIV